MPDYFKYIVGVDEAGRGPLAGPVVVGAIKTSADSSSRTARLFRGIKDSKKLSLEMREEWFFKIEEARERGLLEYAVSGAGNGFIDRHGIVQGIRKSVARSLAFLSLDPLATKILLDGSLFAPPYFLHQETIIRGDETRRIIAMASIVAKVSRDRVMLRFAKKYPAYGFEVHKGYGTRMHYEQIKKYGLCPIHRRSFLKNMLS